MSADVAMSLMLLLTTACRQHMNLYNMGIMAVLYVNGSCEPMDIAKETGMSRTHIYRQLQYLKDKGAVQTVGVRKDSYRQRIVLWGLTEVGRRSVREWERSYRAQLAKLVAWNESLRLGGGR